MVLIDPFTIIDAFGIKPSIPQPAEDVTAHELVAQLDLATQAGSETPAKKAKEKVNDKPAVSRNHIYAEQHLSTSTMNNLEM